ncbi:MAG: 50S ribosomal protein L9 [Deltaproteobacteria bacterium]|nr:50S ribosomal protein L9 [Deltaproteobacteria bacterium]MBW2317624.1 50S ribosomal protein L9 [Deltaproteobacteria bacterium]OEU46005.1 MAG: 50S ribosomal protein L9 [Desulfobacterales bacterium S7086C20]
MKVILKETVESLGSVGDEVAVANGYARNYLFPRNKAVKATPANRTLIANKRKELDLKAIKDKKKAEVVAKTVEGTICTIIAKVSEDDKLYGSVAIRDIEVQLKAQGLEIDKKMILLSEPIKALGSYVVPIRLYADVESEITVKVVSEE